MKRLALLCLLLLLATPIVHAEGGPFTIDTTHTYDMMTLPYAQGYTPRIEGNTAYIVLPLISEACYGDLTAELMPHDISATPIKLSSDFDQTVKRRTYTFSGEKVSAYKVYFKLALHPLRLNGEYPCRIAVSGKEKSDNALNQVFDITLRVTDGRANGGTPEVGIEDFSDGDALYVGGEGVLKLTVANSSITREARSVTLTLADSTGDIMPQASDTVDVGTLAPGSSVPVEIPVRTLASGSAQPHALEFKLNYTYADNQSATRAEKHTVNLRQEVRLNHTEAQLPTRVTQGENVQFNLTLMNMGKGKLYNALLTFDIPHMSAGGSVLAGEIEPGKSAASTANLRVDSGYDGDTAGKLILTWEDGYGVRYEKTLSLSTTVLKKAAPVAASGVSADTDGAKDVKPAARELIAWCLAAAFLVLFIGCAMLYSRKVRKLEEKQL